VSEALTREILRELRYGLAVAADEADGVADDAMRLAEVLPEDFARTRETTWYRRIWERFGQDHLLELGLACASVVQARDLLFECVRRIVLDGAGGTRLLASLEQHLEFRAGRAAGLAPGVHRLQEAVERLRKHLAWRQDDEADEKALPEDLRVLLVRTMIAAAWADGAVSDAEVRLLTRKIQSLELSPRATREVLDEIRNPQPVDRDLADLRDERVKRLLYRNVAAVTVADGHIGLRENLLLGHLAELMGIESSEAAETEKELFQAVAQGGLDTLVRTVVGEAPRVKMDLTPDAEGREHPIEPEPEPPPATLSPRAHRALREAAELWSRVIVEVGARAAWEVARVALERVDQVTRSPSLEAALEHLDPEAAGRVLEERVDEAAAEWGAWLDEALLGALPELSDAADLRWSATGGPQLRSALDQRLAPLLEHLGRARGAGQELARLQAEPLAYLKRKGVLSVLPGRGSRELFLVPDKAALEASEQRVVDEFRSELGGVVEAAEVLRDAVLGDVMEVGAAYFQSVLAPLMVARLRAGHDPRPILARLARRGRELIR
jgi:uncharacterized membrane protein YebE (DUF533 family)